MLFPILNVVWEIRDKILRELLWHPTPLRIRPGVPKKDNYRCYKRTGRRDYEVFPQILRTCKQLYDEGRAILWHANTIGIDLCTRPLLESWQWSVAGIPQYLHEDTEKLFLRRVRNVFDETVRLHIFLDLHNYDDSDAHLHLGPHWSRPDTPAHMLCERLLKKLNLKDCYIEITITGVAWEKSDVTSTFQNTILGPFEMLRCKTAFLHGVPAYSTSSLVGTMMRRERVYDLFKMRDSLVAYVREQCCCRWFTDRSFCADPALDRDCRITQRLDSFVAKGDVVGFLRQKESILQTIDDCYHRKKQKFLEITRLDALEIQ